MSRGGYTSAIDMWSLGCIFGELIQRVSRVGSANTPHLQVRHRLGHRGPQQNRISGGCQGRDSQPRSLHQPHQGSWIQQFGESWPWQCQFDASISIMGAVRIPHLQVNQHVNRSELQPCFISIGSMATSSAACGCGIRRAGYHAAVWRRPEGWVCWTIKSAAMQASTPRECCVDQADGDVLFGPPALS